ncbi:MAG: histidinol-phosphatase [Caldilineaceae bacterium]|jgi:histidinol phosphatase-like enzyme (inositol monophosphatase family)
MSERYTLPQSNGSGAADWLPFIRRLADISANEIRPYFRNGFAVELKEDQSPVTVADRNAEKAMREAIMREYPDHGILGEEFTDFQPEAEYQWVLDPIDGTKAFVAGSYLFGTLIALAKNGRPVVGAINHPIFGDFLFGDGQRTWLNGKQVSVRPCASIDEAVLLNTDHWNVGNHQDGAAFEALTRRVRRYQNWGDCHGYYLVATGGADIMTDPAMNLWDLMALIPVIEGAGGRITNWQGEDPLLGSGSVATAGPIHDQVIRLLNPADQ